MPERPGLTLIESGSLSQVAAAVTQDLRHLTPGPFEFPVLMVRHRAIIEYFQFAVARELGMAASLDFRSPSRLLDLLHGSAHSDLWEPRGLRWRIAGILAVEGAPPPRPLRQLASTHDPLARLSFARKLATRFHQLQLYRSDVIRGWESGIRVLHTPDEEWQQEIWLKLVRQSSIPSLVARQDRLAGDLSARSGILQQWPRSITVISSATLPPMLREALHLAARWIPIRWYLIGYSAPLDPEHLTHCAAARLALNSLAGVRHAKLAGTEVRSKQADNSLLQRVQSNRSDRLADRAPLTQADHSLTFHRCHSPQREVETLRELITAHLDRDPSLQPDQVTVYVSKLSDYLPSLDAVFGIPEPGLPWIPWHLAGRPWKSRTRMAAAVTTLLETIPGRFGRNEILGLLNHPTILRASDLSATELGEVRKLVIESRIRWGVDAADRALRYGLPAIPEGTWRHGLELMRQSGLPELPILDTTVAEGEPAPLTDRLRSWFERLVSLRQIILEPHPPTAWKRHLKEALNTHLRVTESRESETLRELLRGITALLDGLDQVDPKTPISWAELYPVLLEALEEDQGGSQLRGGVRVCQLLPGSVLPARVVLFAGMDDEHFPGSGESLPWDPLVRTGATDPLVAAEYPDPRADHLDAFHDAFNTASDAVHLAWTGRSSLDNGVRSASVVVDELLARAAAEYSSAEVGDASEQLIQEEPLQPFATWLFLPNSPSGRQVTRSGSQRWLEAARSVAGNDFPVGAGSHQPPLTEPFETLPAAPPVEIAELGELVANPPRYFWTRVLRLPRLHRPSQHDEEREPITLEDHGEYQVNRAWLQYPETPWAAAIEHLIPEAVELAPGQLGRVAAAHSHLATAAARAARNQYQLRAEEFTLSLGAVTLTGILEWHTESGQLVTLPQSIGNDSLSHAWVRHLLLNAAMPESQPDARITRLIGSGVRLNRLFGRFRALETTAAIAFLADLLALREELHRRALPLFPRSALAWAKATHSGRSDPSLAAIEAWKPNSTAGSPEYSDPIIQRIFGIRDLDPWEDHRLWEEFIALAERITLPMVRHFEEGPL